MELMGFVELERLGSYRFGRFFCFPEAVKQCGSKSHCSRTGFAGLMTSRKPQGC